MIVGVAALLLLAADPLIEARGKTAVLWFLSADCPISNRYVPELRRLHGRFASPSVLFYAVYPNRGETESAIRAHVREFRVPGTWLRDPDHALVKKTGARVTPEAAVLSPHGRVIYRGRIDDRYTDLGRARPRPVRRDLEEALESLLAGRAVRASRAPAVGCAIQGIP